jgi:hypothetical protein
MVEIWMAPLDGPLIGWRKCHERPQRKQLTIRQQRGKRAVIRPELWDEDWTP